MNDDLPTDRMTLEAGEARVLVGGFIHNGQSQNWLTQALKVSKRIYGNGSDQRIRGFMKTIWKTEFCMGRTVDTQAGESGILGLGVTNG